MANEVEIVVRARDQSAAGIDAAKARLRELAKTARDVPNDVKIKAEADVTKAEAEIARLEEKWARNDVAKFKVQADTEAAEARLEKLRLAAKGATGERKIEVKADVAQAEAKLAALGAKMRHLDADTAGTAAKIERLQHGLAHASEDGVSSLDKLQKKLESLGQKGFSPLITAALALGPALLPVAAQAVTIVGSLANSFASAGAAAGVFGTVVKSTFGDIHEAANKTDGLREKIRLLNEEIRLAPAGSELQAKAMKEQAKATLELNSRLSLLPPSLRAAVVAFEGMKSSWEDFKDKNQGETFGFLTRAFSLVKEIIPKLQPLFEAGATAANKLLTVFERKVQDGGVERLIKYLADHAKGALTDTIGIFTNMARALGNFLKATDDGGGALHWVEQMTAKLADFTKSQAFMDFLDWVHSNGPQVGEALIQIAKSAVRIAEAIAPLAPISLAFANGLTRIINAIPVPVLTGIVAAFIAWNIAMKTMALGSGLAALPGKLRGVGGEAEAASTRFGRLATGAGKAAGALGAVALVIAGVASAFARKGQDIDVVTDALVRFQTTGEKTSGITDDLTMDFRNLDQNGMQGASNTATEFLEHMTSFLGLDKVGATITNTRTKIDEMDQSMAAMVSSGNARTAAADFETLGAKAAEQGISVDQLTKLFPHYQAALHGAAAQAKTTAGQADTLSGAVKGAGTQAATAAGKTKTLADRLHDLWAAAGKAATALLQNRASARALEQAYDDASEAVKKNGRTLDIHTPKGRANAAALDQIASAALAAASNVTEHGGSQKRANKILHDAERPLQNVAQKMGLSATKAHELADALLGIPKVVATNVTVTVHEQGGGVYSQTTSSVDKSGHLHVSTRKMQAHGGVVGYAAAGGPRSDLTLVGEQGPELVDLAPGSTVHSNPDTQRMLGGSGGSSRVVLEINSGGSAMDDLLVQILRKAVRTRGGDVQLVLGR